MITKTVMISHEDPAASVDLRENSYITEVAGIPALIKFDNSNI